MIDGYLTHGAVLLVGPRKRHYLTKGYAVAMPNLEAASVTVLNQLEDELRLVLRHLSGQDLRLQFRWTLNGDFQDALLRFQEQTETAPHPNPWSTAQRSERFTRYFDRMEASQLRREQLEVWVTAPLPSGQVTAKLVESQAPAFDRYEQWLSLGFGSLGGQVEALDDRAHARTWQAMLTPSQSARGHGGESEPFDAQASMLENFLSSEAAPMIAPCAGFYLDGCYVSFLTIRTLPAQTFSGLIRQLTALPIVDVAMTVNVTPLEGHTVIGTLESRIAKLETNFRQSGKPRIESTLILLRERVRRLMSNEVLPFEAQFILRAWDRTPDGLQTKLAIVKGGIARLHGARSYEMPFPPTARDVFQASLPGWTHDRYRDFTHYMEDAQLANLLPVASGTNGELDRAEALYDGTNRQVIGLQGFAGVEDHEAPLHTLLTGMSGGGKSMFLIDFLTQVQPSTDYTCIIDDGFSYGAYARAIDPDARSIVIHPSGNVSFNYLSTHGGCLTAAHLTDVTALIQLLVGTHANEDTNKRRAALISATLLQFYRDWLLEWRQSHA